MPELPDIDAYVAAIDARVRGRRLERALLSNPFLLRTVEPPISSVEGRRVDAVRRLGKRIVLALDGGLYVALHLMIAGRLHWKARVEPGAPPAAQARAAPARRGRPALAELHFETGVLSLTEAGSKRRAALHVLADEPSLRALDRGGVEPLESDLETFRGALGRENHTLKRALTDPRLFSGIGNAYSDEILHRARLSPVKLTGRLAGDEILRLFEASRSVLGGWRDRLLAEAAGAFPEKVTAFREGFAVHGRHRLPCPDCGAPIQRIAHADNETNYCPRCQTEGRILSDRALARLLKQDWPRTIEELERNPALGLRSTPPPAAKRRGAK